jgi:ABC-type glycerol-3-phosphate transport system substrate-binding protein
VALMLVAMLLVAACGGGDVPTLDTGNGEQTDGNAGEQSSTDADGVVTVTFGVQEFQRGQYAPLVEQFNAEHSEMQVQLVSLDDLMRSGGAFDPDQMLRQVASTADTAAPFFITPEAIERGYFQDLQPLMDADPDFDQSDFYPAALDAYHIEGSTYVLPRLVRVSLLSYNQDLWQSANLPAPAPDWGWSDLIAAAEELAQQRGGEVDVYGLLEFGGVATLSGELNAAGIDIFEQSVEELQLDDPAYVEALDRTVTLIEEGAVYVPISESGVREFDSNDMQELVREQRVAMWFSNLAPTISEAELDFALGTAPLPPSPLFSFGNVEGYVMSSGTQHPEEAWRWLDFLSRQPLSDNGAMMMGGGQVPARISVAEETGFWDELDDETGAAIRATLERESAPVPGGLFNEVSPFTALNNALEAVLTDEATPQQALIEAQAELEERIAEVQLTPEPTVEAGPIVVATPVVAQAPEGATAITYFIPGTNRELRDLAQAFQEQHPDIYVDIMTDRAPGDATDFASLAGTADCFVWWGRPAPQDTASVLDLQPLLDADADFDRDDYPAALLSVFEHEGALYGLPTSVSLPTLNYNQTAFEAAGLDAPTAAWTPDDFLLAAEQLDNGAQGANRQYGYVSVGSMTNDLDFFLRRFDAQPVQGTADAPELNFTDPAVIQGAQYYVDLLQNYSPHERLTGYRQENNFSSEPFQLLQEGRIGMWFSFSFAFFGPEGPDAFELAVAPPPLSEGTFSADNLSMYAQFIGANTEHAEACWEWMTFLTEQPALFFRGDAFPARTSVAESPEYLDQARAGAAEVYDAYREQFAEAPADSGEQRGLYGADIDTFWFYQAIDRALQGEDLERELQAAQETTQQFVDCVQIEEDAAACATSVDPDYEGFETPDEATEE